MSRNIDQLFKQHLHNYTAPVPANAWDAIESAIQPAPKRRGFYWILGLSALLIAGAVMWWISSNRTMSVTEHNSDKAVNTASTQSTVNHTNTDNSTNQTAIATATNFIDQKVLSSDVSVSAELPSPDHPSATIISSDDEKNKIGQTASSSEKFSDQQLAKVAVNQHKSVRQLSIIDNDINTVGNTSPSLNQTATNLKSIDGNQNQSLLTNRVDIPSTKVNKTATSDIIEINRRSLIKMSILDFSIRPLAYAPLTLNKKVEKRMESPCLFNDNPKCYDFKGKRLESSLYVGVSVGPDIVSRKLTTNNVELLNLREGSEQMQLSWSTTINGTYVTGSGVSFGAGLHYSRIHEQFDYQGQETRTRTFIIDGVPTSVTQTGTVIRTIYNTLKMVDLPLTIGYEVDMGRYILALNGGGAINIAFSQQGQILNGISNPVSIDTNEAGSIDIFNNNAGVSLLGSIGLYYKLTDNMQLTFEPNIRYRLNSVTKSTYSIEQKYMTIGLQAGVRKKF